MKVNKKMRGNRYRLETDEVQLRNMGFMGILDLFVKVTLTIVLVCLLSLGFIAIHDSAVQSDYFEIKSIDLAGPKTLSRAEILEKADVRLGDNLLAVNLFRVKKSLTDHDWIRDVSVRREFPSSLIISIREEVPLAVIRLENGDALLINVQGEPFKELVETDAGQADRLPVVTGLNLVRTPSGYGFSGDLFQSVMALLALNREMSFVRIDADIDMGLELTKAMPETGKEAAVKLKLGFDDFALKLNKEKLIAAYMAARPDIGRISVIDLFDLKNITAKFEPAEPLPNNPEGGV